MAAPPALTFLGAAGTVTGSMHLLRTGDGAGLLVDCGLYQGRRAEAKARNHQIPRAAVEADALLLTHAHIDHSGNLPTLVKRGFKGKIHCTAATADLVAYMLRDSARIQVHDAEYLNRKYRRDPDWVDIAPLYDEEDAERALERLVPHSYNSEFEPLAGLRVRFVDAGHVLGSASAIVDLLDTPAGDGSEGEGEARPLRVVFSGDIGRRGLPILRDPVVPTGADYVVMESTYGGRQHAPTGDIHEQLASAIDATRERGGKVVIPSFALERTQEIVFALNQLMSSGRLAPIPVFVDSPLAISLTDVFRRHEDCYDLETLAFYAVSGDPFGFECLTTVESVEASKALTASSDSCVIIAASGMCEFGRVVHHLRRIVEDPLSSVVIVGWQAPHTLGRRLVERRNEVRVLGVERERRCDVVVLDAFSAHADRDELLWWADSCGEQVRRFFLVHGDPDQSEALAAELRARGREVVVPARSDEAALAT